MKFFDKIEEVLTKYERIFNYIVKLASVLFKA